MAYQTKLGEEFEETSDVSAKNRKTRVNAPKDAQTTGWNSSLTFSLTRKTLISGTCQIETIICGKNVRRPINR